MNRTLTAAMRRASRVMRPATMSKKSRAIPTKIAGMMVTTAFAPLIALQAKKTKTRKAVSRRATKTLDAALTQLRAAQSMIPGTKSLPDQRDSAPAVPDGAQYLSRKYRGAAGSRHYQLYLPTAAPQGLILMLHGCNQTPNDFANGTHMNPLAEKHSLAVAYVGQGGVDNAASCWNWFKPGDQGRGAGEPALLAGLARKLMREFHLDRDAVFVAGLSAGGAMAVILADVYPDTFAAAGVHSGLARGSAHNVMSAMAAMRDGAASGDIAPAIITPSEKPVRRIIFQGEADTTVNPSNAALIVSAALGEDAQPIKTATRKVRGRGYMRRDYAGADGTIALQLWMIAGAEHAWSGGRAAGSYTDLKGPDASELMVRFFVGNSAEAARAGGT